MKHLVLVLVSILGLAGLGAQDLGTLSIATEEWADCTLKDGTGLYFDVIRRVFADQKPKLDIKFVPFARSVELLEAAKVDMNIGDYEGDVSKGIYPRYPIDYDDLTVMMPAARKTQFAGESSLRDKKVAWIVDYGYDKYLTVPVQMIEVSDRASGIKMLQSGRVDYYIETKSTIVPALESLGISDKDYSLVTVKWIKLYVCFAKTDRGARLQAIWDKRMPELIRSGALKKDFQTWGFDESYAKLVKEL